MGRFVGGRSQIGHVGHVRLGIDIFVQVIVVLTHGRIRAVVVERPRLICNTHLARLPVKADMVRTFRGLVSSCRCARRGFGCVGRKRGGEDIASPRLGMPFGPKDRLDKCYKQ